MAVDGIGKGGPPGAPGIGNSPRADAADRPSASAAEGFSVGGADVAGSTSASGSPGALEDLQSGVISLDQYVEARVDGAVSHLVGKLSSAELDFVKQVLRDQLATDPVLVELLQRATKSD